MRRHHLSTPYHVWRIVAHDIIPIRLLQKKKHSPHEQEMVVVIETINVGGIIPFTTEILTHICSCHNFPPLSSGQIFFITSLLLTVCALR